MTLFLMASELGVVGQAAEKISLTTSHHGNRLALGGPLPARRLPPTGYASNPKRRAPRGAQWLKQIRSPPSAAAITSLFSNSREYFQAEPPAAMTCGYLKSNRIKICRKMGCSFYSSSQRHSFILSIFVSSYSSTCFIAIYLRQTNTKSERKLYTVFKRSDSIRCRATLCSNYKVYVFFWGGDVSIIFAH